MQGKKDYGEKLFLSFQLSERIPENNFYRKLNRILDLQYLYQLTKRYYGDCGQKSIDPVVFFKLCLVGYLENIASDRQLISHCSMRLDILFFLGYDLDEELPWHSTVSRTRQLFPEDIFEQVFTQVLQMCVDKGMVSGHTQCIDSAPVKANASMDSLELKVPAEKLEEHIRKVRYMSTPDRKAKHDKAPEEQKQIAASDRQLNEIKSRNKKWDKDQDQRPGAQHKKAKYTSNHTHYSPTDPDARISVKPGKARKLNYLSQMAVDTGHHVITHIHADFANKKDNQCLQSMTLRINNRLKNLGLAWENLAADTGYSSGENYAFLEKLGITSYIPPHGTYKGGPEGFTYHKEGDYYLCRNNKRVTFRKITIEKNKNNNLKKLYLTRPSDCKACPFKTQCAGKAPEKRITITIYREEYERAIKRVTSPYGKRMKAIRQSTVEPVFGTLTQFLAMRKVNTRGIHQANKVMLMAAMAYNLKKYLRFNKGKVVEMVNKASFTVLSKFNLIWLKLSFQAIQ
jgi:radical SAM protein with 4Fe4S-binding SPASM domain